MGNAYGFMEITGVVAATDALDIMCKAADVSLATWERKLGGRLVTLVIEGEVEAVRQSIEAASTNAIKKPVSVGIPYLLTTAILSPVISRFFFNASLISSNGYLSVIKSAIGSPMPFALFKKSNVVA